MRNFVIVAINNSLLIVAILHPLKIKFTFVFAGSASYKSAFQADWTTEWPFIVKVPLPVSSRFLNLFGRSDREFLGNLDPHLEPTLTQALHIINSPYVNGKLKSRNGTITRLLDPKTGEKLPPAELVTELYLMTLSRLPTDAELDTATAYLENEETEREDTEDLLWALISSRSFLFNR